MRKFIAACMSRTKTQGSARHVSVHAARRRIRQTCRTIDRWPTTQTERRNRQRPTRHDTYVLARARAVTDNDGGCDPQCPGSILDAAFLCSRVFAKNLLGVYVVFASIVAYVFAGLVCVQKDCLFLGVVGGTVASTAPGPEEACNAFSGAAG